MYKLLLFEISFLSIVLSINSELIFTKEEKAQIFSTSHFEMEKFLESYNSTYYYEACKDISYKCNEYLVNTLNYKFQELLENQEDINQSDTLSEKMKNNGFSERRKNINQYNKILSEHLYKKSEYEYFGYLNGNTQIYLAIKGFIISAYFGNPNSYYKLYVLLNSNIFTFYYSELQSELNSKTNLLLNYILLKEEFLGNFSFDDNYEKQSLASLLLYTAAINKNPHAINTIAYKYKKGYGFQKSCDVAKNYYKDQAYATVEYHYKLNKPQFIEKSNIAGQEYVGLKYSGVEVADIFQIIEYYKLEAKKGMISYINQLGQRYLYGQDVTQNFQKAKEYFEQGVKLNDTLSMYYLGELYLNGWGVEKNYTYAYELFKESESQAKSINTLGYMYYYGYGVEKNIRKAYDLFQSKIFKFKNLLLKKVMQIVISILCQF